MTCKSLPLVSLAIPIYNGSEFMRFAIDSALAQTYPNIEIIIVNDGSTDEGKTEEIALSYGDRVRYYTKKNGGVGSALNLALQKSCGEYFCWLSHDDLYLPEKVARQVNFLQSLPATPAVVFCRHSTISANGDLLHELPPPPLFNPCAAAYQLLLNQWLHCCSILAPRSMYLEIGGFREDLPTTQDYDLLMRIGLRYPFYEMPEILLHGRSHPNQGSLTAAHRDELERFFVEHIPMLSPEYMRRCFLPCEVFDAWVEIIVQLRARSMTQGVIAAFRQLLDLEVVRTNPALLFDDVKLINDSQPVRKLSAQVIQSRTEAEFWRAQAIQFSLELSKPRGDKYMNFFISLLKKTINRTAIFRRLNSKNATREIFDGIYNTNYWRGESRSGEGSDLIQTQQIREALPVLLRSLGARSMLDIPCGDYYWMQHVDLPVTYIGADIVQEVVKVNNEKYSDNQHIFMSLDVCTDVLPKVDLIFARDLLVHLSYNDIRRALQNMKKSGSTWLLTTTFTGRDSNTDITTGDWRTLNLQVTPFNFPQPVKIINEGCTQFNNDYNDKSLGLWKLEDLKL